MNEVNVTSYIIRLNGQTPFCNNYPKSWKIMESNDHEWELIDVKKIWMKQVVIKYTILNAKKVDIIDISYLSNWIAMQIIIHQNMRHAYHVSNFSGRLHKYMLYIFLFAYKIKVIRFRST